MNATSVMSILEVGEWWTVAQEMQEAPDMLGGETEASTQNESLGLAFEGYYDTDVVLGQPPLSLVEQWQLLDMLEHRHVQLASRHEQKALAATDPATRDHHFERARWHVDHLTLIRNQRLAIRTMIMEGRHVRQ